LQNRDGLVICMGLLENIARFNGEPVKATHVIHYNWPMNWNQFKDKRDFLLKKRLILSTDKGLSVTRKGVSVLAAWREFKVALDEGDR
jgi:predicted transcriptional regulator